MIRIEPKYTEVLLNLLEDERIKPMIDEALSTYPLYVSRLNHEFIPDFLPTREDINKGILNYYRYREIGFETVGRFLNELEIAMNEIMPYYNQLLFSMDLDYNVTHNVDYTRQTQRNLTSNSEGNTTATNESTDHSEGSSQVDTWNKNVRSDTPQNSLSITNKQIDSVDYATEVTWDKNSSEGQNETDGTSSMSSESQTVGEREDAETIAETIKGNYGQVSAQALIEHYRKLILNVVQDIIRNNRIQELFMTVY